MAYVAPDLKHSDHYTISTDGAKATEKKTGFPITYLSPTLDTGYNAKTPRQPIVVNTLETYRYVPPEETNRKLLGKEMPFLEAARTLFECFFNNHLIEFLTSPWAVQDPLRKIIVSNFGFNNTQGQAWNQTDGASLPGLKWRKTGLSEPLRKLFGLFAVLGSGALDDSVREQHPECPHLFWGATVEEGSTYDKYLDILRDWYLLDQDLRRSMILAAQTVTLNSSVCPCHAKCKKKGCCGKDGDIIGWLNSDDFDELAHPHVVDELRKEARGDGLADIDWTGKGSSHKDVGIHRDNGNGSRPSDEYLSAIQYVKQFKVLPIKEKIYMVGHGHKGPEMSSGVLGYGRDYLTTQAEAVEGREFTKAAKFLHDRLTDVVVDLPGQDSNKLEFVAWVQDEEKFISDLRSGCIDGKKTYGAKNDYNGVFYKFPATANQLAFLCPFLDVGLRLIWWFDLNCRKVVELCYVFASDTNGAKKVCDICDTVLAYKQIGHDAHRLSPFQIEPEVGPSDDNVSPVGLQLLRTGKCEHGAIDQLLDNDAVSLRKVMSNCFRSHPHTIRQRRRKKKERDRLRAKGVPEKDLWKGNSFNGSTSDNRYQIPGDVSCTSNSVYLDKDDKKDSLAKAQFELFRIIFDEEKYQRKQTQQLKGRELHEVYNSFLNDLKVIPGFKRLGVGAYKFVQMLSFFGLVDPRFIDQGHVVKGTGPYHCLHFHFADERGKKSKLTDEEFIESAFDETHEEMKRGNPNQTRGSTEHGLCETWKGQKQIKNSDLTQRDIHPDILLLRHKTPKTVEVQHVFRRKEREVDGWHTTMFEMHVASRWRRVDDLILPPWFCSDFSADARFKRPWVTGFRGKPLVDKPAKWTNGREKTIVPFPESGRVVALLENGKK